MDISRRALLATIIVVPIAVAGTKGTPWFKATRRALSRMGLVETEFNPNRDKRIRLIPDELRKQILEEPLYTAPEGGHPKPSTRER